MDNLLITSRLGRLARRAKSSGNSTWMPAVLFIVMMSATIGTLLGLMVDNERKQQKQYETVKFGVDEIAQCSIANDKVNATERKVWEDCVISSKGDDDRLEYVVTYADPATGSQKRASLSIEDIRKK